MVWAVAVTMMPMQRIEPPTRQILRRPKTSCRYPLKGDTDASVSEYATGNQDSISAPPMSLTTYGRLPAPRRRGNWDPGLPNLSNPLSSSIPCTERRGWKQLHTNIKSREGECGQDLS